jgi:hypothetical protein
MAQRKYLVWAAPWRLFGSGKGQTSCGITQEDRPRLLPPAAQLIRWLPCSRCIGLGYSPSTMVWVGEDQTTIEHTRDVCLGCLGLCWVAVGL